MPYTIVALSYRGYWTSQGRPSQAGIELDARAALEWVQAEYGHLSGMKLVLWGQSIGAGVATVAAALQQKATWPKDAEKISRELPRAHGLILETPFKSIPSMLIALYPQRWLPYRYLGPFLRNWWDSEAALRNIATLQSDGPSSKMALPLPRVLILQAAKDELVPPEHSRELEDLCKGQGFVDVQRKVIAGALHTEVLTRPEGRKSIVTFLRRLGQH